MKMEDHIKLGIGWKQKAKENFKLRTQRVFGIVRNIYYRINHSGATTHFPTYRTAKMLKDHELEVEQKRAEAVKILRIRLTIQ